VKTDLKNVRYEGYIKDPKSLNQWYAAVDFTIHPSTYEAFGQVVTESLQSGTPVIISANVGSKYLVKDNYGLIIDDFEPNTWKEKLENLNEKSFEIPENIGSSLRLDLKTHLDFILNLAKT